jgi:hypothetical protein
VPAGVGGLDGYAEAFTALRKISGVVPSIMCMFGFNAGGGSYLPRQGSFVIQPRGDLLRPHRPGRGQVGARRGRHARRARRPDVHSQSGVTDFVVEDEVGALRTVREILNYIPNNNAELARPSSPPRTRSTARPGDRHPAEARRSTRRPASTRPSTSASSSSRSATTATSSRCSPSARATPSRPSAAWAGTWWASSPTTAPSHRARSTSTRRYKNARFIRFCNLYNIPVVFIEDTTGFLPGASRRPRGIVQAGRAMLDAIVDLRTPRILVILRNAFGGAYASFNNYPTGADHVIALPTTRVAVMGPAGKEFVYKDELRAIRGQRQERLAAELKNLREAGMAEEERKRRGETPRRCLGQGERSGARDPLRARADEPERGPQPRLDLADRDALGPAQGHRGEPVVPPRTLHAGALCRRPARVPLSHFPAIFAEYNQCAAATTTT